ncbi:MAG: aminotransferase class V-fold PLP-dependent enzyme [Deltaproteobacteria bacterium]|nr:aminotransferase class V-fold PLP-dependent enzyme [Deltaproteobacteria bacterium]
MEPRKTIYLDHAATSFPKPEKVKQAVLDHFERYSASPGRSGHSMSLAASRSLFDARETIAAFFHVDDSRKVIFTRNVTESLNLAIYGMVREGDHVVTTSMEHNSVMRPLRDLEARGIIQLTVVSSSPEGLADIQGLARAVQSGNPRLLVVNHASNVTGTLVDLKRIAEIKGSAYLLVDAAQTAGSIPIHLDSLDVDLFAFTGHKALQGPQGTGGLILKTGQEPLLPLMQGGTGSHSEFEQQPDFLPDRFESGTPNGCGFAGLAAGISAVEEWSIPALREHEKKMTERLLEGLLSMDRIHVLGPRDPDKQTAVLSFQVDGISPSDVGFQLDREFGICVRTGLHCAPAAHRTIGTFPQGTVRISMGMTNSMADVEAALEALEWIISR